MQSGLLSVRFVAGFVLAVSLAMLVGAQDAPPATVSGEIAVEEIPGMTALVLPVVGSFEQHATALPQLMMYAGMKGIIRGAPFGIYYDDPQEVPEDSLRWEVCVPVPEGTRADAPFEVREMPAFSAAVVECLGPYEQTGVCYGALSAWIAEQGLALAGPLQEHWLSDMQATPVDSLRARILFPVAKP